MRAVFWRRLCTTLNPRQRVKLCFSGGHFCLCKTSSTVVILDKVIVLNCVHCKYTYYSLKTLFNVIYLGILNCLKYLALSIVHRFRSRVCVYITLYYFTRLPDQFGYTLILEWHLTDSVVVHFVRTCLFMYVLERARRTISE